MAPSRPLHSSNHDTKQEGDWDIREREHLSVMPTLQRRDLDLEERHGHLMTDHLLKAPQFHYVGNLVFNP